MELKPPPSHVRRIRYTDADWRRQAARSQAASRARREASRARYTMLETAGIIFAFLVALYFFILLGIFLASIIV